MNTLEMYAAIEKAKVTLIRLGWTRERVADVAGRLATEAITSTNRNDQYILNRLDELIQKELENEKGRS